MAWTTPPTFVSGQVVTASDMNNLVRDNETYLLSGRPKNAVFRDNNGSYTTTSTSFVDIDGTNLSITLTLNGSAVLIGFSGAVTMTGNPMRFDISVDGTLLGAAGVDGMAIVTTNGPICLVALKTGLSAGSHTFKIQWRVGSGTATLYSGSGTGGTDAIPSFWVMEVG